MRPIALAALLLAAALLLVPAASAEPRRSGATLAVIGDVPYGDEQVATFPGDIDEINADPAVRRVLHLGDIKNGSSRCDDGYFVARLADFERFEDPLVYTPGDNEWTDCHRANNGGYLPTERLATLRRLFFAQRGVTLGARERRIASQSRALPENVAWTSARVVFGMVHVVGSNNGRAPWFGTRTDAAGQPAPETRAERALRAREYTAREAAAVEWIDAIFEVAEARRAPGVVIGMQADMWDPFAAPADLSAFEPIKAVLADRAERFGRAVLLLEGDSHSFLTDTPADMPPNLTRVVVQGSTNVPREYLRLTVEPRDTGVFTCERVEFRTAMVTPCPGGLAP